MENFLNKNRQAKLPENMEDDSLGSMMQGDSVFTTPWAMWVDNDRNCWLHPNYTAHPTSGGTVQMLVELHEDGYHVWPPAGEKYSTQDGPSYVGGADLVYIPVAYLH